MEEKYGHYDRDVVLEHKIGARLYYVRDDTAANRGGFTGEYINLKNGKASGKRYEVTRGHATAKDAMAAMVDHMEKYGSDRVRKLI